MAKKRLVNYIKSQLQEGYNISAIKDYLLRYGYSSKDVDDAINSIYKPTIRHEIHLSFTTVLTIILILASVAGITLFFYFNPQKTATKLLDLNLEPIVTTVQPGENVIFLKELSNLGSSERYDVIIKQEIIDQRTNRIVTQKIETRAIETFGSTQTRILVPQDSKPGDYILRTIVEYDNKRAIATLPVKIVVFAKETCFDGIKNQNEDGVDCGGICKPCETQNFECNDNNPCTNDFVEDEVCVNKPIVPCCGNNICEEQEQSSCDLDCQIVSKKPSDLMSSESLEEIKELAKVDPSKALQQCNKFEVPDLRDTCIANIGEAQRNKNYCLQISNERIRDLCYKNIAEATNDNSICEEISTDGRKDSCYMTFVLDNKDYSVCGKITNTQLRQSCESLRQLNELNEQST